MPKPLCVECQRRKFECQPYVRLADGKLSHVCKTCWFIWDYKSFYGPYRPF